MAALLLVAGTALVLIWGLGGDVGLFGPTEVDDPSDFAYISRRDDCAAYRALTEVLTGPALELDRVMRQATPLPIEEELELGREVLAEIPKAMGGRLASSGPDVAYLQAVADPMIADLSRKGLAWKLHVLEDTKVENALALPGGHIVFTRPFLDSWLSNEAQLAAVLGHELAHVELRHPVALVQYARALGLGGAEAVAQLALSIARRPYSSQLEEEADELGAKLSLGQGYSVFQAVSLWEGRAARGRPPRDSEGALAALSERLKRELQNLTATHPDPARRACRLRQLAFDHYQQHPKAEAYVGTSNLRRRTPASERRW